VLLVIAGIVYVNAIGFTVVIFLTSMPVVVAIYVAVPAIILVELPRTWNSIIR
jgi:hypothetical protein